MFLYKENIVFVIDYKILRYTGYMFDFMIALEICIYLNNAFLIWTKLALFTDHLA